MSKKIQIAPSILSSDFGRLADEIKAVVDAGADMIHVDVMDGHFVPNITIGPPVVAALRQYCSVPMDVHLMIANPGDYVADFANAGADIITFHIEAGNHPLRIIEQIKDLGCRAGIVLNPGTPANAIEFVVGEVEMVLVMTVNPGFGGQGFISGMLPKIRSIREMLGNRDLQVDGGIDTSTAPLVVEAGANILVAGSYVYRSKSYQEAIVALRNACGNNGGVAKRG